MMTIFRLCAALLLALAISGCGQSGPLYLPGDPSQVESPTDGGGEDTGDEDDEDDEDDGG